MSRGHPFRMHAERVEEPAQHVRRVGRLPGRGIEPPQVGVELPVGERSGDLVRPVQRQGGLPHPGGPADGRDDNARAVTRRSGPPSSTASSAASSTARPAKFATPAGSCRGTAVPPLALARRPSAVARPASSAAARQRPPRRPGTARQAGPRLVRQPERPHQRPHRARVRPPRPPALQIRDGAHGNPGPFRQILLGQPGRNPLLPQPLARSRLAGKAKRTRGRTTHDHHPTVTIPSRTAYPGSDSGKAPRPTGWMPQNRSSRTTRGSLAAEHREHVTSQKSLRSHEDHFANDVPNVTVQRQAVAISASMAIGNRLDCLRG